MTLISFLKNHVRWIFVILVLLVVRAYGELALPGYTSDLVDVGIQQKGIESPAPEMLSPETYKAIEVLLKEDDKKSFEQFYELTGDKYKLNRSLTDEEQDTLAAITRGPLAAFITIQQTAGLDQETLIQTLASDQLPSEQLEQFKAVTTEQTKKLPGTTLDQMAIASLQTEYSDLGIDLDQKQMNYLIATGAKMIAFTIVATLAAIGAGFIAARVAARIAQEKRSALLKKVLNFSNQEMDQYSTASLITRSTNDIQQIQMATTIGLRIGLFSPIMAISGIVQVATTRTGMSWIIIVAVAVIGTFVGTLFSFAMPKFRIMQKLIDRVNLVSREILTGTQVIRVFAREKHEEARFDEASTDLKKTQLFTNRLMTLMEPFMIFAINAIVSLIVWTAAKGIDSGQLQVGEMMAFITYTMIITQSFMMLTMMSIMLPRANVSAERIQEVINTTYHIVDNPDDSIDYNSLVGRVSFNDVSFKFPNASEDTLSHITFTAEPGETTAIIGSTGSGKSTILNLLARFYDVTGGSITVDNKDIRDMKQSELRRIEGYVPQKGILFSGTIADNITYGGDNIPEETMLEAARISQATDFIEEKEKQYESPIAQGGSNVSGGQKQRLAIARAIARNPKIYMFDDSFSALDYKTDVTLRRALSEKVADKTVLIVAQRISTVLHANKIIVLNAGKIDGIGTHEELLRTSRTYLEIAESQLSQKELGLAGEDNG
ncbi:ABC transporter ATP-binding protein [Bavariicoccus seileri]|uniref:ABC transporter ATP-binding protein n=1 Tax=Bavariicoccus seileri TaxID=549685 RepID=UPI003F93739E